MKTSGEYIQSIKDLKLRTNIMGEEVSSVPDHPMVRPSMAAAGSFETEDRMEVLRLIEDLTTDAGAVAYLVESMHGAGPPMAQRIMLRRQGGVEAKIQNVQELLGIRNPQ